MNPASGPFDFLAQFMQSLGDGLTALLTFFGDFFRQVLAALLL